MQEAIDELENEIDSAKTDITNITNGTTDIAFSDEDLTATNLADAVSEVNDRVDDTNDSIEEIVASTVYGIENIYGNADFSKVTNGLPDLFTLLSFEKYYNRKWQINSL